MIALREGLQHFDNSLKIKLLSLIFAVAALLNSANAVTITLTGLANSSVGFVTLNVGGLISGRAYFFSSSIDLAPADVYGIQWEFDPVAFLESKLAADPGLVRGPVSFSNGALTSTGAVEMGAVGNKTYLLLVSGSFGNNNGLVGVFQNVDVPASGSILMNPSNMIEDLYGTSTPQMLGGILSGFQLPYIPEPATAVMAALGALGVLRRRR